MGMLGRARSAWGTRTVRIGVAGRPAWRTGSRTAATAIGRGATSSARTTMRISFSSGTARSMIRSATPTFNAISEFTQNDCDSVYDWNLVSGSNFGFYDLFLT